MLLLTSTSDIVRVITNGAADIEVHASYVDNASGTITPGRTNTASITTATTTTVVGSPGSSTQRNVKHLNLTNNHASVSCSVAIEHYDGTNAVELIQVTLLPGENLVFTANGEWKHLDVNGAELLPTTKLDVCLFVASDVVNATTSFADITGLTYPLKSGKKYAFDARIVHISNATTTGARFGVNIGAAPTLLLASTIDTVTASVTASVHSAGTVNALDTAITAQTTGSAGQTLAVISGFIQPSADGTFALRCASEVAVAAGLTVKAGSWLRIRECDN